MSDINVVTLSGRLIREADFRMTPNGMAVAKFTLGSQRATKDKATGKFESDFPSCIAFGKTAEVISNNVHQGDQIIVTGRLQTGSYTDKNGVKKYTTDVIVDRITFGAKSTKNQGTHSSFDSMGASVQEEIMF